jgi:hypothetical protein
MTNRTNDPTSIPQDRQGICFDISRRNNSIYTVSVSFVVAVVALAVLTILTYLKYLYSKISSG